MDLTTLTAPPRPTYDDLPHLMSLMTGDEKHTAAATSTLDVLWVLYDRVLRVSPATTEDPERDRFYLSKGHGPMAYYATLAAKGFIPVDWLAGWGTFESPLGHHPDRVLVPGVEISSGSLGHGLPLGVGTALGLRAQGLASRVVVLVGDAELDEGSNHEAVELAGALSLWRRAGDHLLREPGRGRQPVVDVQPTGHHPRPLRPRGLARRDGRRPRPRRARAGPHSGAGRPARRGGGCPRGA